MSLGLDTEEEETSINTEKIDFSIKGPSYNAHTLYVYKN